MQNKNVILIVAMILVVALFFWKDRESQRDFPDEQHHVDRPAVRSKPVEEVKAKPSVAVAAAPAVASDVTNDSDVSEETQKAFAVYLRQLGQCFGIQTAVDHDLIKPEYEQLAKSLSPSLGDVLVKLDDWTQADIQMNDGSRRRVRTEIEYLENNTPTTRLQLYKMNADNMPELQMLTPEQEAQDPEELAASMVMQGRLSNSEKGLRAYFSEGEELVVVERNGRVQSFSLTKGERSFSCSETDSPQSRCQCL